MEESEIMILQKASSILSIKPDDPKLLEVWNKIKTEHPGYGYTVEVWTYALVSSYVFSMEIFD